MGRTGWRELITVFWISNCIFIVTEVRECLAIPAWARKYGVGCDTCHRPDVPRLNVEGHTFRKLGYRFPDEVGKKPDYKELGDYAAAKFEFQYNYQNPVDGKTISSFDVPDATLFYAGPVTENLSGFMHLEWDNTDEIGLIAQMSWLFGTADRYLNVRAGQMHTLYEVGWAGFDRPSGISAPNLFEQTLTNSPVPFQIGQAQKGIELAFGPTRDARIIAQVLNGLNFNGEGDKQGSDTDKDKDFQLAYEQILDSKGSGFTLFAYRGVWHQEPGTDIGGVALRDAGRFTKFVFYRYGATASILFDMFPAGYSEILGGAVFSDDRFPKDYPIRPDDRARGQAYFAELEQYLHTASVFARADFINDDTRILKHRDKGTAWTNKYAVGSAYMVNNNLRLALEVFGQDVKDHEREYGTTVEAMLIF